MKPVTNYSWQSLIESYKSKLIRNTSFLTLVHHSAARPFSRYAVQPWPRPQRLLLSVSCPGDLLWRWSERILKIWFTSWPPLFCLTSVQGTHLSNPIHITVMCHVNPSPELRNRWSPMINEVHSNLYGTRLSTFMVVTCNTFSPLVTLVSLMTFRLCSTKV